MNYLFQIKLAESLVSSLMLQPAGRDMEVAWVDGCVSFPSENIDKTGEEGDRQGWFLSEFHKLKSGCPYLLIKVPQGDFFLLFFS